MVAGDRLLGDGARLFLRVSPHGTKTWLVEYEFHDRRRKFMWVKLCQERKATPATS
jgi:hypothetical protein